MNEQVPSKEQFRQIQAYETAEFRIRCCANDPDHVVVTGGQQWSSWSMNRTVASKLHDWLGRALGVSAPEPEPALPVALQGALGRLSMTMDNPAVQWAERSCIEAALVEEAIRRLSQPPFLKRRPYLEESDAWASAEDERDWWRNYALQIEEACLRPTKCAGRE